MRICSPQLKVLLDGWTPLSNIAVVDLYIFTLQGGEELNYSGWQKALSAPLPDADSSIVNFVLGPRFNRTKTKTAIGVQVDEVDIDIIASTSDLIGTLTWQHAARVGLFDGAYCEILRCFMSPPGTVIGTITWLYGRVGDVDAGRTRLRMKVRSLLDLLSVQMPRRLYQASCNHVFGGPMCLFDRTTMAQTISAQSGSSTGSIATTLSPSPSTLFDQGTIVGLTGANTGYRRTIAQLTGGFVFFLKPWFFTVNIGDQFQLLPGCDHTVATCNTVFNNLIHYGGFPYIPPPETAV